MAFKKVGKAETLQPLDQGVSVESALAGSANLLFLVDREHHSCIFRKRRSATKAVVPGYLTGATGQEMLYEGTGTNYAMMKSKTFCYFLERGNIAARLTATELCEWAVSFLTMKTVQSASSKISRLGFNCLLSEIRQIRQTHGVAPKIHQELWPKIEACLATIRVDMRVTRLIGTAAERRPNPIDLTQDVAVDGRVLSYSAADNHWVVPAQQPLVAAGLMAAVVLCSETFKQYVLGPLYKAPLPVSAPSTTTDEPGAVSAAAVGGFPGFALRRIEELRGTLTRALADM